MVFLFICSALVRCDKIKKTTQKICKVLPGFEPGLLDSKSKVIAITLQNQTSPAGFEPAISRFVVSRLIHWATGTKNDTYGIRTRAGEPNGLAGRRLNQLGQSVLIYMCVFCYSATGNRTPGICVTGRDVTNYTIAEIILQ